MTAKKIALFIDADNVSAKFGKKIFDALESRGEIFIRRIYGNWEKPILRGWNDCILNFSLRPVQQTDFATGKNATDMSLTIDAMDVLHGGKAEIFALVSNDSDFTPLAIRLREGGMNVIGLGGAKVSSSFRAACNEFIDLDNLAEIQAAKSTPEVAKTIQPARPTPKSAKKIQPVQMSLFDTEGIVTFYPPSAPQTEIVSAPVAASSKVIPISDRTLQSEDDKQFQQLHAVLHETTMTHGDINGFVNLSWAGDALGKKNISLKGSGHSTLSKFIAAFPNLYETRQSGGAFCYRCLANIPKSSVAHDKLQQLHNILREAAATHGDAAGFSLLNHAGQAIKNKNLGYGVKDFGYNHLRDFVADFPDIYETTQDNAGQHFRYRCR